MSYPSPRLSKVSEFLQEHSQIGQREFEETMSQLQTRLPRKLARTKWGLLSTALLSALCALAAFISMQTVWATTHTSGQPSSVARSLLIDIKASRRERLEAVTRIVDISGLNVEALLVAAKCEDPDVVQAVREGLEALRTKLNSR